MDANRSRLKVDFDRLLLTSNPTTVRDHLQTLWVKVRVDPFRGYYMFG